MRILLAGSRHWGHLIHQHSSAPFVPGQAEFFYWKALCELGHELKICRYTDPTSVTPWVQRADRLSHYMRFPWRRVRSILSQHDICKRNIQILDALAEFQPDIMLISGGMGWILSETIRQAKQNRKTKVVLMYADSPILWITADEKQAATYYDLIVTNDYYDTFQWKALGVKSVFALPISGFDPEFHRPIKLSSEEYPRYRSEICFVGRLTPVSSYAPRVEMLEAIADLNLSIWTEDRRFLESRPTLRDKFRGVAFGEEMVKVISAAKVSLNSVGYFMPRGGNMRTFEIAGIGTFQLIDRYDPAWFQEGEEIVSFQDHQDLRAKLTYYLQHAEERQKIAQAGRKRALECHTYKNRMKALIDLVQSLPV